MSRLRLSREQRAAFFDGQAPRIAGDGKSPVEPGYVYELSAKLSFTVIAVRRTKAGGWSLQYEVFDRRDPVRNLRRVPPLHIEDGGEPTAQSIKDAAEESAYTSKPTSLSDAGEAPPKAWQDEGSKQRRGLFDASRGKQLREADIEREIRRLKHLRARLRRGEDIEEDAA